MLNREIIEKTEVFLKRKFDAADYLNAHPEAKAYRIEHTYRVANIGRELALKEGFDETEMVIACTPEDYSASIIARAVEDCNAHVLNINLTGERTETGKLVVDIRFDHRNGANIVRSLERYGFEVLDYAGSDNEDDDTARLRAVELMKILDI